MKKPKLKRKKVSNAIVWNDGTVTFENSKGEIVTKKIEK